MSDLAEGLDLVRRAFDSARASGKDNWQRMTIAVLKNRILTITGGQFREQEFGATSFRDFLNRLPQGALTLDDAHRPTLVLFHDTQNGETSPHDASHSRVRNDLWRAALDYSSGRKYVWDSSLGQVKVAVPGDQGPFLPTASANDLSEWRASFAAAHAAEAKGDASQRLERWISESLPTAFLPPRLRSRWSRELKRRTEERLRHWFRENHLEIPPDFISSQGAHPPDRDGVERLRHFLVRCIGSMTEEELASLQIPARAAMRIRNIDEP